MARLARASGGELIVDEAAWRGLSTSRGSGRRLHAGAAFEGGRLTEREREVAELVADGRSNKQIAAALFLSEKTVEGALTRVYANLGVRSRTQLARTLGRH